MTFENEVLHATGRTAVDENGMAVGTVTDVVFDQQGEPKWAVVDPGLLHRSHFVPLDGAYETTDGALRLPLRKEHVKAAPVAPRDHVVTPEIESELHAFYSN